MKCALTIHPVLPADCPAQRTHTVHFNGRPELRGIFKYSLNRKTNAFSLIANSPYCPFKIHALAPNLWLLSRIRKWNNKKEEILFHVLQPGINSIWCLTICNIHIFNTLTLSSQTPWAAMLYKQNKNQSVLCQLHKYSVEHKLSQTIKLNYRDHTELLCTTGYNMFLNSGTRQTSSHN